MRRVENFRILTLIAAIMLGFVAEAHALQCGQGAETVHDAVIHDLALGE